MGGASRASKQIGNDTLRKAPRARAHRLRGTSNGQSWSTLAILPAFISYIVPFLIAKHVFEIWTRRPRGGNRKAGLANGLEEQVGST